MKPNDRRCISCRKVSPKQEFWRIVRTFPSGQVQLDEGMGRSAYICPQLSCLQAAQKKNRLGRSLHASVPETLYQTLWQRLAFSSSPVLGNPSAVSFGGEKSPGGFPPLRTSGKPTPVTYGGKPACSAGSSSELLAGSTSELLPVAGDQQSNCQN